MFKMRKIFFLTLILPIIHISCKESITDDRVNKSLYSGNEVLEMNHVAQNIEILKCEYYSYYNEECSLDDEVIDNNKSVFRLIIAPDLGTRYIFRIEKGVTNTLFKCKMFFKQTFNPFDYYTSTNKEISYQYCSHYIENKESAAFFSKIKSIDDSLYKGNSTDVILNGTKHIFEWNIKGEYIIFEDYYPYDKSLLMSLVDFLLNEFKNCSLN